MPSSPELRWDLGTAYDFFISLVVLHKPADHGLRGVWAAGMRSRLPAAERDFLEEVMGTVVEAPPMEWIHELPPPKDAATALRALEKMPAVDRIAVLTHMKDDYPVSDLVRDVADRRAFTDEDVERFRSLVAEHYEKAGKKGKKPSKKEVQSFLGWWTRPEEFGERILKALQAYYDVFFAEEERRIYPALQDALEEAQALAEETPLPDLLEELSKGLSLEEVYTLQTLTLAPAFWSAPLIYFHHFDEENMLILFGARPDEASLIPGEVVPDLLVRSLKALSDPTRLKIMHYLAQEAMTPTQLAHKLRLRAPTVVHHLQTLRVAGLVQVTIAEGKERSYGMRVGSVLTTCDVLHRFLRIEEDAEVENEPV